MTDIIRFSSPMSAPLSKAVRAGDLMFLSGQTPKNAGLTPMRGGSAVKAKLSQGVDIEIMVTAWAPRGGTQ